MAQGDTLYRVQVALSDVDRGVYESLDLRLARHASESSTYFVSRLLAYCLCYEEGIAFSREGLASSDEPPVFIRDHSGQLRAFIDVGTPSTERIHRAAKAAPRVIIFTTKALAALEADAAAGRIYRPEMVEIALLPKELVQSLELLLSRNLSLELVHTDGTLYVSSGTSTFDGAIVRSRLKNDS
jgi:uncharacterized protein YaeQ